MPVTVATMETLRDFVAEVVESQGAAIEALEPEGLGVLAPAALRRVMGWPELVRLGFGAELPDQAVRSGLEKDWLDRLGGLLGENGRWGRAANDAGGHAYSGKS